ncbi:zinc-binding dehydrogenase [Arthrobacter sp. R3-55]
MKHSPFATSTMRALAVSPEAPGRIAIQDVPMPSVQPGEVLVEIHAISLNRGEMRALRSAPAGVIPGWDFAGVLMEDVSDELRAGSKVLGIVEHGAWAEMVAVRRDSIAAIPDEVTFAQAAALPTAALTALRTLRLGAAGLGDHVLVTGASGGVGQFAVQLAAQLGAMVTALVSTGTDADALKAIGAKHVVTDLEQVRDLFDVVIESVGGQVLGRALSMLDSRGRLVAFGNSSDELTTFNVRDVYNGALVKILGFELFFDPLPFGRDLATLLDLMMKGKLAPHVADVLPWDDMAIALDRLGNRTVGGKLILTIKS